MNKSLELYPAMELKPKIQIIKQIPKTLNSKTIELAVWKFIIESDIQGDPVGVFNQTIEAIANSTFMGGQGDVWMAENNGEVAAYVIARFIKEIDGKLTYWVSQAWVNKIYRGQPVVKEWWDVIKAHATRHFCKHLVIVSSRNPKAYERWFGTGMKEYATLMMEDLG